MDSSSRSSLSIAADMASERGEKGGVWSRERAAERLLAGS
jgi:hypothetical protein